MTGGQRTVLGLFVIGALAMAFIGLGIQGGLQCGLFGCPLNAGVFAAAGARAAQSAFVLAVLFVLFGAAAATLGMPLLAPGINAPGDIREPFGAARRKIVFWRSLHETSPTSA